MINLLKASISKGRSVQRLFKTTKFFTFARSSNQISSNFEEELNDVSKLSKLELSKNTNEELEDYLNEKEEMYIGSNIPHEAFGIKGYLYALESQLKKMKAGNKILHLYNFHRNYGNIINAQLIREHFTVEDIQDFKTDDEILEYFIYTLKSVITFTKFTSKSALNSKISQRLSAKTIEELLFLCRCCDHTKDQQLADVLTLRLDTLIHSMDQVSKKTRDIIFNNYVNIIIVFGILPRSTLVSRIDSVKYICKTFVDNNKVILEDSSKLHQYITYFINVLTIVKIYDIDLYNKVSKILSTRLYEIIGIVEDLTIINLSARYMEYVYRSKEQMSEEDILYIYSILTDTLKITSLDNENLLTRLIKFFHFFNMTQRQCNNGKPKMAEAKQKIIHLLLNLWEVNKEKMGNELVIYNLLVLKTLFSVHFQRNDKESFDIIEKLKKEFQKRLEMIQEVNKVCWLFLIANVFMNVEEYKLIKHKLHEFIPVIQQQEFKDIVYNIYGLLTNTYYETEFYSKLKKEFMIKLYNTYYLNPNLSGYNLPYLARCLQHMTDTNHIQIYDPSMKDASFKGKDDRANRNKDTEQSFKNLQNFNFDTNNFIDNKQIGLILNTILKTVAEDSVVLMNSSSHNTFYVDLCLLSLKFNKSLLNTYYFKVFYPIFYVNMSSLVNINQYARLLSNLIRVSAVLAQLDNNTLIMSFHLKVMTKLLVILVKHNYNERKTLKLLNIFYQTYIIFPDPFDKVSKQRPKYRFLQYILRKRNHLARSEKLDPPIYTQVKKYTDHLMMNNKVHI